MKQVSSLMIVGVLFLIVLVLQFLGKREHFDMFKGIKAGPGNDMPGVVTATNFDASSNQATWTAKGITSMCVPDNCLLGLAFLVTYDDGSTNMNIDTYPFSGSSQGTITLSSGQQASLQKITTNSGKHGNAQLVMAAVTTGDQWYQTISSYGYSYKF